MYELDQNKVYKVDSIPNSYVLKKHPNALLNEIAFKSPYIVKYYKIIYDVNTEHIYTVMEKVKGASMDQLLQHGCPSYDIIKNMIFKILKGFEVIHNAGVLHRDVCMKNIFVEFSFPTFTPKVSGFNIFEPYHLNNRINTSDAAYLAPEVWNYSDYNVKSEIWAIGMLIFNMLDAKFKFSASTKYYKDALTELPRCFRNFIRLALAEKPADRPGSLSELITILYEDLDEADRVSFRNLAE